MGNGRLVQFIGTSVQWCEQSHWRAHAFANNPVLAPFSHATLSLNKPYVPTSSSFHTATISHKLMLIIIVHIVRYMRERRWIEITWIPHAMVNDLGGEKRMSVMEIERRWDICLGKKGEWGDDENDCSRLWDTQVIDGVRGVWFSDGDLIGKNTRERNT